MYLTSGTEKSMRLRVAEISPDHVPARTVAAMRAFV
jgi:hypothetical protein